MPFGPAVAAIAAPVVGGLVQGALAGSGASNSQAISQAAMQKGADNYASDKANYQPFISTGQNALSSLADFSGLNGQAASSNALANFQASPGFQYQEQQGLQAVDHGAAANGMLRSGETLRSEQTLGNNLASTDFNNYVNRLSGIANMGIQGAQLGNQDTATYDNLLTGNSNTAANAAYGSGVQQASIYGNAINGAVGGYTNAVKNGLFSTGVSGSGGGGFNSVSPTPTPGASWGV